MSRLAQKFRETASKEKAWLLFPRTGSEVGMVQAQEGTSWKMEVKA